MPEQPEAASPGRDMLEGIRDIKAHKTGENTSRTHALKTTAPPQVIRANLKVSQFALHATAADR
jgi:hypothetical protein